MTTNPERWTIQERLRAIDTLLEGEDSKRFIDVYSLYCSQDDRNVFLRDAERRSQSDDEIAGRWWNSLRDILRDNPERSLALVEPLAQHGIAIDELHGCLPYDFDPQSLIGAINRVRNIPIVPFSNTDSWSDERIGHRLSGVKTQLDWEHAPDSVRRWWETFESESASVALRLAEQLAKRKATVTEFHEAYLRSHTNNIRASLHYLDYLRLTLEAPRPTDGPVVRGTGRSDQSGLTPGISDWWLETAPRMTKVRGWTGEQIRSRLEKVKERLKWADAADRVRAWWEAFERENQESLALVLRLAEELAERNATISQFQRSFYLSKTSDIRATLCYLDYLSLTTEQSD